MKKYMMATKAIHKLGDISRDVPDLCLITGEDAENYIGNWVEGFGFVDVNFPKTTTRDLTADEVSEYDGKKYGINGVPFLTVKL